MSSYQVTGASQHAHHDYPIRGSLKHIGSLPRGAGTMEEGAIRGPSGLIGTFKRVLGCPGSFREAHYGTLGPCTTVVYTWALKGFHILTVGPYVMYLLNGYLDP